MNRYLAGFTVLFASSGALGAECNCTSYPFKPDPPCFDFCTAKLVAKSDSRTLVNVLGLKQETAQTITAIPVELKPRSLSGYERILPPGDYMMLKNRLQSLTRSQLDLLENSTQKK